MAYERDIRTLEDVFDKELKSEKSGGIPSRIIAAKYVLVYGAGSGGTYAKYLLSLINVCVYAFLDTNAEMLKELDGIQVCLPDGCLLSDEAKRNALIIIGVGNPAVKTEIEQKLYGCGYSEVIHYIELFNEVFLKVGGKTSREVGNDFYIQNRQDIIKGLSLFEDQESRDIYCGFVKGHALKKNEYFAVPEIHSKYFPKDIEFNKGYGCFIDCGAARGETYGALEKQGISPETLVMFEPDSVNFSMLVKTMRSRNKTAYLYPCAVYSKTCICGFVQSATQGSSISADSKDVVQCAALDDVLLGLKPTFIKMDIEGGEYEALLGAKSVICSGRPDLAICVYHAVNHIWDIPILVNSLNPGYKLYLRSGNIYGMNTVLYATTE